MKNKTNLATALFVAGLLAAGAANALSKLFTRIFLDDPASPTVTPFLSTLMFCLNLGIYFFLLLCWVKSVKLRLLPSRERSYLISAALCAVTMLVLRSTKYRLISESNYILLRFTWYLYYIPMVLLPTLFLMTCLRIESKNHSKRFDERWLLIPAGVISLLFLTNDLHHFAFIPKGDREITGGYETYSNGFLLYVYYGYYVVTIAAGLVLLTMANRRTYSRRKVALPFLFLGGMLGLTLIDKALYMANIPSMFLVPETVSFGMIGVFESCVRNRQIPYNENYAGFFSTMKLPAVITNRDLSPVYSTAQPVAASRGQLSEALTQPVYLDDDLRLYGHTLRSGNVFYTEDESELNRLNEQLTEANELIASENELIQTENDLKARRAYVDSRNMIYADIAERMYPYHLRVEAILKDADPDAPDFAATVARLNILNAYIKRGSNLLLVDYGGERIPLKELRLAFEESARYLRYCGVQASVNTDDSGGIEREKALAFYTAFQDILEQLLGLISLLNISYHDGEMRLVTDCGAPPPLRESGMEITVIENEGLTFIIVKEGDVS